MDETNYNILLGKHNFMTKSNLVSESDPFQINTLICK